MATKHRGKKHISSKAVARPSRSEQYDAFTQDVEYVDILAQHVEERLHELGTERENSDRELCALHVFMTQARLFHQKMMEKARALYDGGAR